MKKKRCWLYNPFDESKQKETRCTCIFTVWSSSSQEPLEYSLILVFSPINWPHMHEHQPIPHQVHHKDDLLISLICNKENTLNKIHGGNSDRWPFTFTLQFSDSLLVIWNIWVLRYKCKIDELKCQGNKIMHKKCTWTKDIKGNVYWIFLLSSMKSLMVDKRMIQDYGYVTWLVVKLGRN